MSTPYLSVIIPAYREAQRIAGTLQEVLAHLRKQSYEAEVLVVDDGSPDGTATVVERFQRDAPELRLLRHEKNRGKGAAVRTGMMAARGAYALFADADNATPFSEIDKLLAVAGEGEDIVVGSRYLPGSNVVKKQSFVRRLMSRAGNLMFRALLGLHGTDTRCGFKLFSEKARKTIFPYQTLERWGFDTELLVIAAEHDLRVREVPVRWYDRERGNIHPFRDSLRSLGEIVHIMKQRGAGRYH